MKKLLRFLAIFWVGVMVVVGLGYWASAQAQTSLTETGARRFCNDLNNPTPIALPLNATTDAATNPRGRQISHRPCDDTQAIVGNDTRLPVLNRFFPWSAIGRLEWRYADGRTTPSCTGTLIGRDLVLTNSHCLENPRTQRIANSTTYESQRERIVFKPSLVRGRSPVETVVTSYDYGWKTGENHSEDWALLKLKDPLGEQQGYLGWRVLDFTDPSVVRRLTNQIILAGYSGDYPTDPQRARVVILSGFDDYFSCYFCVFSFR
jgi:V8-like Glu-specific endopeptidase